MGSWYVMQWCLTMVELDISIVRSEGKNSRTLKRGQQVPPNCLCLTTKPHGVTSHDFNLNKLKSRLHITCVGLIYMSTRVIEPQKI